MSESQFKDVADETAQRFMKAYNAGGSIVELFSPDCKTMAPDIPRQTGPEGVKKVQELTMAMGYVKANVSIDQAIAMGSEDDFYTTFKCTVSKEDGSKRDGKGVYIWKKIDGKYLIDVNIWNYDN
ncbi:uncharacterized protein LOC144437827 [Glandiceps talaboti]